MKNKMLNVWRVSLVLTILLSGSICGAYEHRYYLGLSGGASTIAGGDGFKFTARTTFGACLGYWLGERWFSDLSLSVHENFNDSTAISSFSFSGEEANATLKWNATRIGLTANRVMFEPDNRLNLFFGFGGGLMMWEILDPANDTTIDVRGALNEWVDYSASEIFLTGRTGFELALSGKLSLNGNVQVDYLTGAGAEFESSVKAARDHWQLTALASLKLHFGAGSEPKWKSSESWTDSPSEGEETVFRQSLDGDGDGVPNELDNCLDTPPGVAVDKYGCSLDTDGDGVSNGLDDCPATDPRAIGMVDIYGCPVDSDFDGIPDYLDACPFNQEGAHVDNTGCPIDSDADGVPDGLDDCPHTLYGVDVDQFGCIDLSMLSTPMVLNIDYAPGSFEIDFRTRERLKQLSRVLNFVPSVRMEINGYTDNIGTDVANKRLSEKRANRVRDFLVTQGIDGERIKVFGRGETNFVASNQTAEGRAQNRRIEIIFFK
ncbi:MAG: OmpA family protein [Candidatus Zixiibacteriota bacterium]|nr:MAG: OmpA family protein [candidate division Zixibacteria bacterium]